MKSDFEPHKHHLRLAHLNASSIPKHKAELQRVILETDLDAIAICETNIKPGTPAKRFKIPGYKLLKHDRVHTTKGGVGVYFKDIYKPKKIDVRYNGLQPELIFIEVEINKIKMAIGVIYKSPGTSYGIYSEIQEILAFITTKYSHVILMGDFNIDLLKDDRPSQFFREVIMAPFNLHQIIKEPTRITENTATSIDHFLVTNPDQVKISGVVDFPGISDHCLIYMAYNLKRQKFKPTKVIRRDFSNFDKDAYILDMERAPWGNLLTQDENGEIIELNDKVTIVENIYREYIDKHAPYKEKIIKRPVNAAWMTDEILALMDTRDKFKNMFNRYKDNYFLNRYKELKNNVTHQIRRAKMAEFKKAVNDKINDSRKFHDALKKYNIVSSKKNNDTKCPFSPDVMNEGFCASHNAEVDLEKIAQTVHNINIKPKRGDRFSFQQVSERDVLETVRSLKSNACGLDEISSFFVKLSIEHAVTAITDIINTSFATGKFPERWKKAIVIPIPKLDIPLSPSDYRPISLLSVLSKIIEKIAAKQIVNYLTLHQLLDPNQSAYRKNHGCPTALLKITDDFFEALDRSDIVICALLDYSKAFNCANHDITLAKLKNLGFANESLRWINSYLSGRAQRVKTHMGLSQWKNLANGVPQGSILGPLLFTILLNDFGGVLRDCNYHLYADDSQVFLFGQVDEINDLLGKMNQDLQRVAEFSDNNNLSLNVGKCKYIIFGSSHNLKKLEELDLLSLEIKGRSLKKETEVYNLGVLMDQHLSWDKHINKTISNAYGKLKNAYLSKNFLDRNSKIIIVEYYILSQMNYCNIIMQNLTQKTKSKIQQLQNACTRFIFGLRKYDHISNYFRQLNVPNMENRRTLHSATLMHKITNGKAPVYLCSKICYRNALHMHNTRGNQHLHIPRYRNGYGRDRFFRRIAKDYNRFMGLEGFNSHMSIATFKRKLRLFLINNQ